jgi:hypothetical protein
VNHLAQNLKERWRAMDREERVAVTKDAMKELDELREMKELAPHNAQISAFHDVRSNIAKVEQEVR